MSDAAETATAYFCHQCSSEVERVSPDFTCIQCGSGFIEELNVDPSEAAGGAAAQDDDEFGFQGMMGGEAQFNPLFQMLGLLGGGAGGSGFGGGGAPGPPVFTSTTAGRPVIGAAAGGGAGGGAGAMLPHPILQEILSNIVGMQFAEGMPPNIQIMAPEMQMYGNPGDYAWGRGGLDAIVTQLLNQLDGAGPPPLKSEYIQQIPEVNVSQEHLNSKMQCSVCWEDFSLGEKVRKLHCDHLYHEPCIVPWLELHGTCPVCRKSQEPGGGGAEKPAEGAAASSEGGSRSGSADAEAAAAAQSNSQSNNAAGGVAESIRNNLLHMFGMTAGSAPSSAPGSGSLLLVPSAVSSSASSAAASASQTADSASSASATPGGSGQSGSSSSQPSSTAPSSRQPPPPSRDQYEDYDLE